ncbi:MAG: hypothetical protein GX201_14110 [Clostridiales bacterium]|nr:hypothetical protein [Clostridiales bacterium]
MKEKFYATIKGKNFNGEEISREAQVFFTPYASADISSCGLTKTTIVNILKSAGQYLLTKKEGEKFRFITSYLPVHVFVSGRIIYRDELEMEILVTRVSLDAQII